MTVRTRLFRFIAVGFAAIQIVAVAGAPALESALVAEQARSTVTVDQNAPDRNVPSHDPSTCALCQLINSIAAPPHRAPMLVPSDDASDRVQHPVGVPRQHDRRQGVFSRAPPTRPA